MDIRRTSPGRAIMAALFLLAGLAGCVMDDGAEVTGTLTTQKVTAAREGHPLIGQDGVYFAFPLDIIGYKGRNVPVAIFTRDGEFLGSRTLVPSYEASEWDKVRIFAPISRLRNVSKNTSFDVYVLSPDKQNTFIQKQGYGGIGFGGLTYTWDWKRYWLDYDPDDDQPGIRLVMDLHIDGDWHEDLAAITLVRDTKFRDFPASVGGPFRKWATGLSCTGGPPCYYKDLVLHVPYWYLAKLDPTREVVLTPSLRLGETIYPGNIHFFFNAGGSLDRVGEKVQDKIEGYDASIADLERQLRALGGK